MVIMPEKLCRHRHRTCRTLAIPLKLDLRRRERGELCTDDEVHNDGEELGTKHKTSQDISVLFDAPDQHPVVVGSSQGQYHVRQMRASFTVALEARVTHSGDA